MWKAILSSITEYSVLVSGDLLTVTSGLHKKTVSHLWSTGTCWPCTTSLRAKPGAAWKGVRKIKAPNINVFGISGQNTNIEYYVLFLRPSVAF